MVKKNIQVAIFNSNVEIEKETIEVPELNLFR